jgi:hypothetical protein
VGHCKKLLIISPFQYKRISAPFLARMPYSTNESERKKITSANVIGLLASCRRLRLEIISRTHNREMRIRYSVLVYAQIVRVCLFAPQVSRAARR